MDELSVKCLLYANDQVILALSACRLQEMDMMFGFHERLWLSITAQSNATIEPCEPKFSEFVTAKQILC
ncbi:hypothetical protein EVAR_25884_1 [Eumeta japonica]|uniref:Uncharacterized protein n=1 Tax=Eumeta variegata TaxID=151549 RepID=A0A4C1W3V8_EUMVA|nr:hypothetical protein EVAR_25884_1 [Eumeta japonica]